MKKTIPILNWRLLSFILAFGYCMSASNVHAQNTNSDDKKSKHKNKKTGDLKTVNATKELEWNIEPGMSYNLNKMMKLNGIKMGAKSDKIQARIAHEIARLKDPSGNMPENIRQKSLEYVSSAKAGLVKSNALFRNSPFGTEDIVSPWIIRGPYNVGGRTRALAYDMRNENILLAGGVSGGMWRSTDQGATWTKVTPNTDHPSVTDVVQDPLNPDTWYYSTGENNGGSASSGVNFIPRDHRAFFRGNGIYKSTDNGVTWNLLPATEDTTPEVYDSPFEMNHELKINPVTGDLYVATYKGLYRSQDDGDSFDRVFSHADFGRGDVDITSTGVVYYAVGSNTFIDIPQRGIYRSTTGDSGDFTEITPTGFSSDFERVVFGIAPSNENIVYFFADQTDNGSDIWKYTYLSGDGSGSGGTWEDRTANRPDFGGDVGNVNTQRGYNMYIEVHPTDPNMVFLGATNIYRSADGFATTANNTWIGGYSPINNISVYPEQHPDNHRLIFFNSDPDKVLVASDGGVAITDDVTSNLSSNEPVDWMSLNNGYYTTQPYALAIGPDDQLMAGFQDNGTWFTSEENSTANWPELFGGDGAYCQFNDDATVRYVSSQNGNLIRFRYASGTSSNATSGARINPETGAQFITPFERDPLNDEVLYFAGESGLWVTTNASTGADWTLIAPTVAGSRDITSIAVSTIPSNVVYIGYAQGVIQRIDNTLSSNPTVTTLTIPTAPSTAYYAGIDIDPYDADHVMVAISNYLSPSLFESRDGGNNWDDVGGNLEENPDGSGSGPSIQWIEQLGDEDLFFVGI